MGLLDALGFERKDCALCGEKLNILGNAKLKDGKKICKRCLSLKSPFLTAVGGLTLEQYEEHLAYREANREVVDNFNTTHVVAGSYQTLYIDFDNRNFIMTSATNWRSQNPDVMSFDEIINVDFDIRENKSEERHKDADGKMVSYNPPRYKYSYDFKLYLTLNNKWWSEVSYRLDRSSIQGYNNSEYDNMYMETEEFCEVLSMLKSCSQEELEDTLEYYKQWKAQPTRFDGHYYYEDRKYYHNGDFYSHRDPRTRHSDYKYTYRG